MVRVSNRRFPIYNLTGEVRLHIIRKIDEILISFNGTTVQFLPQLLSN